MIKKRIPVVSIMALFAAFTWSETASAQTEETGFVPDRFDPSERGSDWFSTESLDLRGSGRFAVGVTGDWAHKPLVLYGSDDYDGEEFTLVKNQATAHIGASVIMWNRLRLGLNLPVVAVNSGMEDTVNGYRWSPKPGLGDIRVGLDVRVVGQYGDAFTAAVGLQARIPTMGNKNVLPSDGLVGIAPRLLAAGDIGLFAYSARLGVNIRTGNEKLDDQPTSPELLFGAAAGVRLIDKKLLLGPELYGSSVISGDGDGFLGRRTTPIEIIAGAHYAITDSWRIGVGAGPGLTHGQGSPLTRVLASVEWFEEYKPPVRPSDRDGDGISDNEDACPDEAGVANTDPNKHGCPLPLDRDGDGISDNEDACPDEPGVPSADPQKHGCKPADRDGDGIPDSQDACPDEPGQPSSIVHMNGCPPPKDRDGDGIPDDQDACPEQHGPANADPTKNGCPIAVATERDIKINSRVEFDTMKTTLRRESHEALGAVLQILRDNPDIKLVEVEGHTDERGSDQLNASLSLERARTIVNWLVARGIARKRLSPRGYGSSRPIESNDTELGRQNNRRVQFTIVERSTK